MHSVYSEPKGSVAWGLRPNPCIFDVAPFRFLAVIVMVSEMFITFVLGRSVRFQTLMKLLKPVALISYLTVFRCILLWSKISAPVSSTCAKVRER